MDESSTLIGKTQTPEAIPHQSEEPGNESSTPTAGEADVQEAEPFLRPFVFDPDAEPPPEEPIFEGFLAKGDLTVWIGREKHRKTNILLQLSICAAVGRNFLHFPFTAPQPQRVVMVDYESKTRRLKERYEAICRAMVLGEEEKNRLKENLLIVEVPKAYKAGKSFPRFPVSSGKTRKDEKKAEEFWQQFAKDYPADLYIFDPMRSMHAGKENDSTIEFLLTRLRRLFPGAAVVVAHHMRKTGSGDLSLSLKEDMRAWSDGARGSGAIKAHADVVVCQERKVEGDAEVVYWGAFQRDEADIEPMALDESEVRSFYWQVSPQVPEHLRASYDALKEAQRSFSDQSALAQVIQDAAHKPRSTAYRHIIQLKHLGLLVPRDGEWVVAEEQTGVS